jgi:hypothetical protein
MFNKKKNMLYNLFFDYFKFLNVKYLSDYIN